MQSFYGAEVHTDRPVLDTRTVTLMDFAVPQEDGIRFFYVLPFAPDRTLVEDTRLGVGPVYAFDPPRLAAHVRRRFGGEVVAIGHEEHGTIPLDPWLAPPTPGPSRIVPIGTRAGAVRAASGYTLDAIQRASDGLARDLTAGLRPYAPEVRRPLDRWMDAVWLDVVRHAPARAPMLFRRLFARCPTDSVLRLLNDRGRPSDYVAVAAAMPWRPFLEAVRRVGLGPHPIHRHDDDEDTRAVA